MSKQTIGYRYYAGILMGLCRGRVDEIVEVQADGGSQIWSGSVTSNTTINLNLPNLFGGDQGEGGLVGTLDLQFGAPDQAVLPRLAQMQGANASTCRGVTTAFYNGEIGVGQSNVYPKSWLWRVRRAVQGWDGGAWYPEKAVIALDDGNGNAIKAMNPAHIYYQLATDRDIGRGLDRSLIDDASFRAAADQLYTEGFGLCKFWSRTDSVSNAFSTLNDHVGAVVRVGRSTGLLELKLIRDDYDVDQLPSFDYDSGLLSVADDDSSGDDPINQIVVTWHDPVGNLDHTVRVPNPAAIRAAGGAINNYDGNYDWLPTYGLALRVAQRELRAQGGTLRRLKPRLDRRGRGLQVGDAFRISAPDLGIENMVLRAGKCTYGTLAKGDISISAAQDQYYLPSTSYIGSQPSGYQPPDRNPSAPQQRLLYELSYRDLADRLGTANVQALDVDAAFLGSLAMRPSGLALNYTLSTRLGSAAFADAGQGDWTPGGTLAVGIGYLDNIVQLLNTVDLDQVDIGAAALIDSEIVRIDAINLTTGQLTIARGCADTPPAKHLAGARMWIYDSHYGYDPTEYITSEQLSAKLLTRTPAGELDPSLAPTDTITMQGRAGRPYPPGNLQINGARYPDQVVGALALSWAHRDRLLELDQLIDTTQGNIGPETGTTYTVRIYVADQLVSTTAGITGTTATPAVNADGQVRVEISAVRDGLTSLQALTAVFDYTRGQPITAEDGDQLTTETGTTLITES